MEQQLSSSVDNSRETQFHCSQLLCLAMPLTALVHHGCRVLLKKSGVKTPRIELEEIGPSFDLVLRRHQMAPSHLYREACKVPRTVKVCLSSCNAYDCSTEELSSHRVTVTACTVTAWCRQFHFSVVSNLCKTKATTLVRVSLFLPPSLPPSLSSSLHPSPCSPKLSRMSRTMLLARRWAESICRGKTF